VTDPTAAIPGAEWNAQAYDRLANPMQSWGETILGRMDLRGDETALDLGCGSGRLTEHLLRRLPRGHVFAVDRSANMLDAARAHLEPMFPGQTSYVQRSLELIDLDGVADLAFSNAALHWVPDHPRLFAAIFRALKPGGLLIAQCGGGPNILSVRQRAQVLMDAEPLRPYFEGWPGPWEFASEETTQARLRSAGFAQIETSMFDVPVVQTTYARCRDYLENVILGTHLARIPSASLRDQFLDTLAAQFTADDPPCVFDYWRLNIRARRPV
jgi:trans-aconitate 2-methyltransferase